MNFSHFSIFLLLFFQVGCSFKLSPPEAGGPATIFENGSSFFALFPATENREFNCGQSESNSIKTFTLTKKLILSNEESFRKEYHKLLIGSAENLHPDSTAYIVEYPGDYMIAREVSKRKLIRERQKEFKQTLKWDRQYLGFVNSQQDTALVINLLDPKDFRSGLGYGWVIGADAALEKMSTLAFSLTDSLLSYDICKAIYSKPK